MTTPNLEERIEQLETKLKCVEIAHDARLKVLAEQAESAQERCRDLEQDLAVAFDAQHQDRRFQAACAAMQGFAANPDYRVAHHHDYAKHAVGLADYLLAELECTK